jgi:hypothetical protein
MFVWPFTIQLEEGSYILFGEPKKKARRKKGRRERFQRKKEVYSIICSVHLFL